MVKRVVQFCKRIAPLIQILTLLTLVGTLVFVVIQTNTLRSDYEARTRPYLAIEDIAIEEGNGNWLYILIDVASFGEVPATNVNLQEILMGGEDICWTSTRDYVIPPQYRDFASDLICFPGKHNSIPVPVYKATWESAVMEGSVMEIALTYSWRERQYWYVAKATLQSDSKWSIASERGN